MTKYICGGLGLTSIALSLQPYILVLQPYWLFFFFGGLFLFSIPIFSWISKRFTKNKYQTILNEIEKSRAEAASLQIEGMQLADETALDYWTQRVNDWKKLIYGKLYKFNSAEAGKFDTLGVFPVQLATGTKILNAKHESILRNLIRRMEILNDIRDRWIKP